MVDITKDIIDWLRLKNTNSGRKAMYYMGQNGVQGMRRPLGANAVEWVVIADKKLPKWFIDVLHTGNKNVTSSY